MMDDHCRSRGQRSHWAIRTWDHTPPSRAHPSSNICNYIKQEYCYQTCKHGMESTIIIIREGCRWKRLYRWRQLILTPILNSVFIDSWKCGSNRDGFVSSFGTLLTCLIVILDTWMVWMSGCWWSECQMRLQNDMGFETWFLQFPSSI